MSRDQFDRVLADGGLVIDVGAAVALAGGQVLGALSIPLRDQLATWLGRLVEGIAPPVFIAEDGQDLSEVGGQTYRISYERFTGCLAVGMAASEEAGRPQVDVRQAAEYRAGHVPGALHGGPDDHLAAHR